MFSALSFGDQAADIERLGGYQAEIKTGSELLDPLECLLFEPLAKRLGTEDFCSTGCVICFHGMPPSRGVLEEWGNIAQRCGLLGLGVTLAVPNMQMSSALQDEDFERVIQSILERCGATECCLLGKGWGGPHVINYALRHPNRVCGLVLASPTAPAPEMTKELDMPALLLWARDDDVIGFEDAEEYLEALDGRCAPTTFQISDIGGHTVDRIVTDYESSESFKHFLASVFLLADLDKPQDGEAAGRLSERSRRLSGELPSFLVPRGASEEEVRNQLTAALPEWIQSGLLSSAE